MELETLVSTRKAATNEKSSDKYSEEPEINHKAYGKNNRKIINSTRKKEKKRRNTIWISLEEYI